MKNMEDVLICRNFQGCQIGAKVREETHHIDPMEEHMPNKVSECLILIDGRNSNYEKDLSG
jgi:hypothetical protein